MRFFFAWHENHSHSCKCSVEKQHTVSIPPSAPALHLTRNNREANNLLEPRSWKSASTSTHQRRLEKANGYLCTCQKGKGSSLIDSRWPSMLCDRGILWARIELSAKDSNSTLRSYTNSLKLFSHTNTYVQLLWNFLKKQRIFKINKFQGQIYRPFKARHCIRWCFVHALCTRSYDANLCTCVCLYVYR